MTGLAHLPFDRPQSWSTTGRAAPRPLSKIVSRQRLMRNDGQRTDTSGVLEADALEGDTVRRLRCDSLQWSYHGGEVSRCALVFACGRIIRLRIYAGWRGIAGIRGSVPDRWRWRALILSRFQSRSDIVEPVQSDPRQKEYDHDRHRQRPPSRSTRIVQDRRHPARELAGCEGGYRQGHTARLGGAVPKLAPMAQDAEYVRL